MQKKVGIFFELSEKSYSGLFSLFVSLLAWYFFFKGVIYCFIFYEKFKIFSTNFFKSAYHIVTAKSIPKKDLSVAHEILKKINPTALSDKDICSLSESEIFKVMFAYDVNCFIGSKLRREVSLIENNNTSVDFLTEKIKTLSNKKIAFELTQLQGKISADFNKNLSSSDELSSKDSIKLRRVILDKCYDKLRRAILDKCYDKTAGQPIKFSNSSDYINIIVVSVSDFFLGGIDFHDCLKVCLGSDTKNYSNSHVALPEQNFVGLFEGDKKIDEVELTQAVEHFREIIDGVLFAKFTKGGILQYGIISRNDIIVKYFHSSKLPMWVDKC